MKKALNIDKLKKKYPGANIVLNDPRNPTEIVCEVDPKKGRAIAIIDKSIPHVHKYTKERYIILDGNLDLYVDGVKNELKKGDIFDIKPGQVHYAIGNETWVEALSKPPWTPKDHIIIKGNK